MRSDEPARTGRLPSLNRLRPESRPKGSDGQWQACKNRGGRGPAGASAGLDAVCLQYGPRAGSVVPRAC